MDDADREDMIDVKRLELLCATTSEDRRYLWAQLRELLNGRSAAQIERLEHARGLR